ncbi:MAG TPA: ATP-binding protein [bacterium]|nr:ATP-binding protein [bacterium]
MLNSIASTTQAFPWNSKGPADSSEAPKPGFHLGKKGILSAFRLLVFLALAVLLYYKDQNSQILFTGRLTALLGAYLLSILVMPLLKNAWVEDNAALSAIFLTDILFITGTIYLGGIQDVDLFLILFTTIFISALSQDVKSVFAIAVVSCSLYSFLQVRGGGRLFPADTEILVRFPFLFVAASLSGFLAMETKKHKEDRQHLADMNRFLAEQADSSVQKYVETNRKLKTLLEYHHCVLASIKTGIIVARNDGRIRTFNSGARQITGFVEAEMAEKPLGELPGGLAPVAAALKRTLEEEKSFVQDHLELTTARSETIPVTLETSVLKGGNGEVIGAIATLRDMTLLRQMETQLLRSERFSALGEMAAGVAHEIKNPLNAISGFSRRLSAKLEDPALRKYADIIAEEVRRMDGIVNDVLEYSRPDHVNKAPSDMNQLLEETAHFLHEKIEAAGVQVEWNLSPVLPQVEADIPKVRQVALNLILNALQAMPQGGKLSLKTRLIEGLVPQAGNDGALFQQLFLQQKMVAVSVGDTGCGIPKENISKLFHPFFTTKITGTGLGLSICHKIIAAHGGNLDVESEVGKGSTFTFYLPLGED